MTEGENEPAAGWRRQMRTVTRGRDDRAGDRQSATRQRHDSRVGATVGAEGDRTIAPSLTVEQPRWWRGPLIALGGLILLAAFGGLPFAQNVALIEALQRAVPRDFSDPLAVILVLGSTSGSIFAVGVGAIVLFIKGQRRVSLALGLLGLALLIEFALKSWIGHPAVPEIYHRDPRWYPVPDLGAGDLELPSPFPSGHALRTTFLALVGTTLFRRYLPSLATLAGAAATIITVTVSMMLMVMGWHWITDVAAGILLGYAAAAPARYLLMSKVGATPSPNQAPSSA